MTTTQDKALRLASLGWKVFPARLETATGEAVPLADATPGMKLKKMPIGELVEHGFKEATDNPKRIRLWWRVRPDALIGVSMPKDTVALDVDDPALFEAAGLELHDGPGQQTLRGGYHRFFRSDGRRVRQTVKEVPGADTRVGGKGYVVAWDPDAFPAVSDLPPAPEWLYSGADEPAGDDRPRRPQADILVVKMGERDNKLTSVAGSLRKAGLGKDAIYAALKAMVDSGQVEQTREDPITDKDLRRISGSIGGRHSQAVDDQRPARDPVRQNAADLIGKDLPPIEYVVEEILPEGVGVVSGAPKAGKSFLMFQAAVEVSVGGEVLGRDVPTARPVLYYGLEDGERRFQKRLKLIDGGRNVDLTWLEIRYSAPLMGAGLEEEIEKFLSDNGDEVKPVVIIDVLAMVWPEQSGKGSAYNQDYRVIGPLKEIQGRHPGSTIVALTHNRKQGSDDIVSTMQGTHGISGAVDWMWIVRRERGAVVGTIYVTGRDIEHEPLISAKFAGLWTADPEVLGHARGTEQQKLLDEMLTGGDGTAQELADRLNADFPGEWDRQKASRCVNTLLEQRLVENTGRDRTRPGAPVTFHALTTAEVVKARRELADEQNAVLAEKPGWIEVRRVPRSHTRGRDAPAQDGGPLHGLHTLTGDGKGVKVREGSSRARSRAPASTGVARIVVDDDHEPEDEASTDDQTGHTRRRKRDFK